MFSHMKFKSENQIDQNHGAKQGDLFLQLTQSRAAAQALRHHF